VVHDTSKEGCVHVAIEKDRDSTQKLASFPVSIKRTSHVVVGIAPPCYKYAGYATLKPMQSILYGGGIQIQTPVR
jgi:hypothetical protein